jgi:hypothetical protein
MRMSELFLYLNPKSNSIVVKARYKKMFQGKYGVEQWGIIEGNSLILIDNKCEKHGTMPLSHFVKDSIQELTIRDLQDNHRQKSV